ncbi:MAG TPA: RNA methyltransferase [Anaerolineaceae bacterium]|nr:RNA methyltransferase [Anaerolineaceae bacterium]
MLITSPGNPRIKQIRKLRERKERQESGLFYIEGLRIVAEAVQQGADIETLVAAPELLTSDFGQQLLADCAGHGLPVLEVSADVFANLSLKEGPVGLAAVARQKWDALETVKPDSDRTWVALDAVADPGNLGTILRTHDGVGGVGLILLDHSTDPFDPTAIRASMGAVFSQKLVRCSFEEFASWKQGSGCTLVGAAGQSSLDYQAYRYPDGAVLLMGSERQGLQPHHLALCDAVVSIPMVGRSDSLNLAMATGIILYEIFNQRRNRSFSREGKL